MLDDKNDIAPFKWGDKGSPDIREQLAELTGPHSGLDQAEATLRLFQRCWDNPSLLPRTVLFEAHRESFNLYTVDSGEVLEPASDVDRELRAEFLFKCRKYLTGICKQAAANNPDLGVPHIPHLTTEFAVLPEQKNEPVYLAMAEIREAGTGDWLVVDHARRVERFEFPAFMFLSLKRSELVESIDLLGITPSFSLEAVRESLARVEKYQQKPDLASVMLFPSSVVSETYFFLERQLGVREQDSLNLKKFLFESTEQGPLCTGIDYILRRGSAKAERFEVPATFTVSDHGTLLIDLGMN